MLQASKSIVLCFFASTLIKTWVSLLTSPLGMPVIHDHVQALLGPKPYVLLPKLSSENLLLIRRSIPRCNNCNRLRAHRSIDKSRRSCHCMSYVAFHGHGKVCVPNSSSLVLLLKTLLRIICSLTYSWNRWTKRTRGARTYPSSWAHPSLSASCATASWSETSEDVKRLLASGGMGFICYTQIKSNIFYCLWSLLGNPTKRPGILSPLYFPISI
jgi:hypothetical protein